MRAEKAAATIDHQDENISRTMTDLSETIETPETDLLTEAAEIAHLTGVEVIDPEVIDPAETGHLTVAAATEIIVAEIDLRIEVAMIAHPFEAAIDPAATGPRIEAAAAATDQAVEADLRSDQVVAAAADRVVAVGDLRTDQVAAAGPAADLLEDPATSEKVAKPRKRTTKTSLEKQG